MGSGRRITRESADWTPGSISGLPRLVSGIERVPPLLVVVGPRLALIMRCSVHLAHGRDSRITGGFTEGTGRSDRLRRHTARHSPIRPFHSASWAGVAPSSIALRAK